MLGSTFFSQLCTLLWSDIGGELFGGFGSRSLGAGLRSGVQILLAAQRIK